MKSRFNEKSGFTLVELIIIVTIIVVLAIMLTSALNPGMLSDRGFDTRRKKDLARIKVAFEDYFNDKGCYPQQSVVDAYECGSNDFSPWIGSWLCDPSGVKYKFQMGDDLNCPRWFKVMTNLRNRKDEDIPIGWYGQPSDTIVGDMLTIQEVNYGVSSSNISWYQRNLPPECLNSIVCYLQPEVGRCTAAASGRTYAQGAFLDVDCSSQCKVECCKDGRACE